MSPKEQPSDLNETIRLASHIEKVKSKVKTKHKEHLLSKNRQQPHSKQGMLKNISKIGKVAVNGEAELKSLEKEAVREKWKNTLSKTKEVSCGYHSDDVTLLENYWCLHSVNHCGSGTKILLLSFPN
ncbi:uncharacterized protein LOC124788400 [Schistocerca piceifrons]|uniref:uncharacterized protein LOC124788400 n=1 Tax=Schistocerca piceifrons TaxID=274613 RepID=UPI001F5FEC11|nr:uncharacterized protein LOC124788400 [Schistocerca piceifrons]